MTELRIFKEGTTSRIPRKRLARLFAAIVKEETSARHWHQVNLVFTTDRRIRSLNRRFRSRDRATDVLSFQLGDSSDRDGITGEVYISISTAKRQAREYCSTVTDELLRLACHGLLHLLGYDHVKPADAEVMKAREDYFLEKIRGV
jgi:probable rRNA maturation factor